MDEPDFWDDAEAEDIDWEMPSDEIRSSEVDEIVLTFVDNGKKLRKMDDKGIEYNQFKFRGVREDISNPREITYITSSKRLVEDELSVLAPIEGKTVKITRTGSGFQTRYKAVEV